MKFLYFILFCICLPLRAADWYVDAAATGSANGTSWANAWTTTASIGWSSINSGDTLWFRQGTYERLSLVNEDGVTVKMDPAATGPAVFQNLPDFISQVFSSDDVLIDGLVGSNKYFHFIGKATPYTTVESLFTLKSSRRVTLRGLTVSREDVFASELNAVNGIRVDNGTKPANEDITIEDCNIRYVTGDGVNINNSGPSAGWDKYMIRRCTIFNTGDDGVQASGNVTLLNNNIDQNGQASLFGGHPDGIQTAKGASYIRIEGNYFSSYTQNIFVERGRSYIRIANNIMKGVRVGSTERGMILSVIDPEDPDDGIIYTPYEGEFVLANNTFYQFRSFNAIHGGGTIERLVPIPQRFFGNNIFVNCLRAMGSGYNELLDSTNIYWDLPGVQYYTDDGDPIATPVDSLRQAGSSTKIDPRLIDPASGNFELAAGSPAIGTGTNFSAYFTTDYNGDARPADPTAWDAGAIIYDAGSAPADVTAPTVTAAINETGNTLVLTFSEAVVDVNSAHYSISGGSSLSSAAGSGTAWTMTISPVITSDATITLSYTSGAGRTADLAGNLLATIAGAAVTNNSLETTPDPPKAGRKGRGVNNIPLR